MAVIKCKMCGGDLNLIEGASTAECEFCGSVQTVPKVYDEKKLTLFARANRLRAACDFDKAAGVYEALVADFPEEAEAYWGLVLCKYGIEYVDDPATGNKVPTCHRSSFDSVMEDTDFEQALENADGNARKVYRDEAKAIEEIRKGIIEVSSSEEPYDIFICYKETAPDGERTIDSVLAQDVYDALTDKGYRVFFSRITLEDKLGVEYEPYIFAALNSAKIMLAFGTDYEYFNAVWVKNEWSRYLKLMAKDKDKHLIPCYKGIDAYDMPKEFAKLQAQDLGKVGATQDLLRGIAKILPRQESNTVVIQNSSDNVNAMVMRGQFALEDGDWAKASEYFERALDENPEEAKAYLGKVLAGLQLSSAEQINDKLVKLYENKDFERAIRFSTGADKTQLESIKEQADKKWLIKCFTTGVNKLIKKKEADEKFRLEELKRIAREKREEEERIAQKKREEEERIAREKRKEEERIAREKREEEERIAREKREEEERVELEKAKVILLPIREKLLPAQSLLSLSDSHTVAIKSDGTVVATGYNDDGQCNVSDWQDIVAISTSEHLTVGLKSDGTVVATGFDVWDACKVSDWCDIVAIAAGHDHTVGLKSNGTVVAIGYNNHGQCNVSDWRDIIAVYTGEYYTIGLKSDGTVVATGENDEGQCNVSGWKDIVTITTGTWHTVGLKSDGTVVATGNNDHGRCNVSRWKDIVAISADFDTVGLKADGTIVIAGTYGDIAKEAGKNIVAISSCQGTVFCVKADGTTIAVRGTENWKDISDWKDIVAIRAGDHHIVGLKSDGTLVSKIDPDPFWDKGQSKVGDWKLFDNLDTLEQERVAAKQKAQRRAAGLCQHCGGQLKGLFGKKCVSCGRPKDY